MLGALTKEQIQHVLQREILGRIGCCVKNEMYIVPITFVYYKDYIYAHSKEGQKIKMMRQNPHVCFQVDSIENMNNWRSVLLWGEYEELKGDRNQKMGMKILTDKLLPFLMSETTSPSHRFSRPPAVIERDLRAVVFRIRITQSSGRFEKNAFQKIPDHVIF